MREMERSVANQTGQAKLKMTYADQPDEFVTVSALADAAETEDATPGASFAEILGSYKMMAGSAWQHLDTIRVQHMQACLTVTDQTMANVDKMTDLALAFARGTIAQTTSATPQTPVWPVPGEWLATNKSFCDSAIRQLEMVLALQKKLAESAMLPLRRSVSRDSQG